MTKLSSIHRKVAKSSMFQLLESASFLSLPVEPIKNFHAPTFREKDTFYLNRLFFSALLKIEMHLQFYKLCRQFYQYWKKRPERFFRLVLPLYI